jgi:hypothetical protein
MTDPSPELMAMVAERDFCDFPTAWAIQRAGIEHIDRRCSAAQTAAWLCDCGAVEARWRELRALVPPSSASVAPPNEDD